MKKVLILIFITINLLSFAANYDLDIRLIERDRAILGYLTVTLEKDENPYFALYPNLDSYDNPL
ncbi:hypothetical protein [Marinitoga lauensis]|uniref:hypothetical protein n=1 Tax=Marinitoga lauensis TaxID=2201189 RepID=UPI00101061C9|nr:hypothetical protein [Marinitoga lauensis]